MILSDLEIQQALDAKRLIIDPELLPRLRRADQFCPYGTHSVDLRLGGSLSIPQQGPYNFDLTLPGFPEFLERNSSKIVIEADRPYLLNPGRFVLGITLERVSLPIDVAINHQTKTCLAARIEGKSSRARSFSFISRRQPFIRVGTVSWPWK